MKNSEYFATLFDSLFWARDGVLAAAEGMTDEEFGRENGFSEHSIRGALIHTLAVEGMYVARAIGKALPPADGPESFTEVTIPSVAAMKARWLEQEKVTRALIDGLTDEKLDSAIVYTRRDGVEVNQPLWQILTALYQHTLQHRSEAAEALTLVGRSPGGLDFALYLASLNEK